jgi:hypothetical protein
MCVCLAMLTSCSHLQHAVFLSDQTSFDLGAMTDNDCLICVMYLMFFLQVVIIPLS